MSSKRDQNQHNQKTSPSMDIPLRRGKSRFSKWKYEDTDSSDEDTPLKDCITNFETESWIRSYFLNQPRLIRAPVPIRYINCNKPKKPISNMKMLLQDMDSASSATSSSVSSISTGYDSDNSMTKKFKHDNRPKLHFRKVPAPILKKTDNKLILRRIMCDLDSHTTRNTTCPTERNGLSIKYNKSINDNKDLDKKVHDPSESKETSSSEEDLFMKRFNKRQKQADEEWKIFLKETNYHPLNTKDGS